jgi:large subunit ribosomal protein L30
MRKIKVTQIKSSIGYRKQAKATLEALGLRKINHSVVKEEDNAISGMIRSVSHLVKVEEVK